jgi:hypothetical protein
MAAGPAIGRNRGVSSWRRPLALVFSLAVLVGAPAGAVLAVVPPFSDIAGHRFASDIDWLRREGLTNGCGGGRYCPDGLVTRAQMASFLDRALDLPATGGDAFRDDEGSSHEAAINRVAAAGITFGCDPGLFCPNGRVTRAQMASFLSRAFDLKPSTIDWFADDDRSTHQEAINRVAWAGITVGCGASIYCPNGLVTRGQMAAFLHRGIAAPRTPPSCTLFPATNVWNRRVDSLPVVSNSATMINTIGAGSPGHPDFGEYLGYGIPVNVVDASTPRSSVSFTWPSESNAGPYPIPPSPKVEGGSDRHILRWDVEACRLYELFAASHSSSGWHAGSGAIWNLRSNALRPDGWTSADAAGLPILPGLVRFDEVASGAINHAIRFTAPETRDAHIYPARHHAGDGNSSSLPPMGLRVRLKAGFDMSDYSPRMRVILIAMQRYGMILADNGSPWYFSGVSDIRWDDDELNELKDLRGSDFEVVNTTGFVNGG